MLIVTFKKLVCNLTITIFAMAFVSPSYANPSEFIIDDAHTHIVWNVKRFGFTDTVGTFATVNGVVSLDQDNPQNSRVTARIALSGLRSDLIEREDIIRGPYWLDAATHPTITFESEAIDLIEGEGCELGCANVHGKMNLKGVEALLTLVVKLNKIGTDPVTRREAAGFSAEGQFNRSEFGIATALGPIDDSVSFEMEVLAVSEEKKTAD